MTTHSAKSLFDLNIESAQECIDMYDGLSNLKVTMKLDWLLRASIVFVVSALDTYFHDKVKYKAGKFSLDSLPTQLGNFQIPIKNLANWEKSNRKGNVLRNWLTDHYAVRPLQSPTAISDALKLVGYEGCWDKIAPKKEDKKAIQDVFNALVKRRNQIAHEGDREQHRNSGKKLRKIDRAEADSAVAFAKDLVAKFEAAFPK